MKRLFTLLLLCSLTLSAKQVKTFYGFIEVEEPVLLELIECKSMQRLKDVHQYGVSYYTTHKEEYNRYDHSLGVFAVLRKNGASVKEQIAGLLHDVSHTTFSHVGDWIYEMEYGEKDYQNSIHIQFLENCEIKEILEKYGYTTKEVDPIHELFPALECSLPHLCADRIDYNIQGAYYQNFITYDQAIEIFHGLKYVDGIWISEDIELMKKLTLFSIFMSEDCWGSPFNHFQSRWLSDAILHLHKIGAISSELIQQGKDHELWTILKEYPDPIVKEKLYHVENSKEIVCLCSEQNADQIVKSKFRGINPWILLGEKVFLLTDVDPEISEKFNHSKKLHENGWPVKLKTPKRVQKETCKQGV